MTPPVSEPYTMSVPTPRSVRSRTQSISSDRPSASTMSHSLMSPPLSVSPEAAFIAASAASQIVTTDHDSHAETWYDQVGVEPLGDTALVSPAALQLANNFVDQLLFNIISIARSTSLSGLRPAVSEVLKPKLAKDAISQADEELREYLGGGEVEDLVQTGQQESPRDWDLELAWKRTRLRCMVYSSLGDMEEEDEDYYMEQEHLSGDNDELLSDFVSPAVAIFLTSILEFMGEQVLVIAGQATFNRLRLKYEKEMKEGSRLHGDVSERIVVEELDMERVALDRTMGRLWRAWKKRLRSPGDRPFSYSNTRRGSMATEHSPTTPILHDAEEPDENNALTKTTKPKAQDPRDVPLPIGDNDVDEIEVPGLVHYSDDEEEDGEVEDGPVKTPRPKSFGLFTSPVDKEAHPPFIFEVRQRSQSVPARKRLPYKSPSEEQDETAQKEKEAAASASAEIPDEQQSKGPISKLINGAAAVGAAALSGVAAAAAGKAPQTEPDSTTEDEDLHEEPRIMTSSRVSVGGRDSPGISETGGPPSLVHVRSNSVQSARLIDVQPPRSPSVRSRAGSSDVPERLQTANLSRDGSLSSPTPPIVEEKDPEVPARSAKRETAVLSPTSSITPSKPASNAAQSPPERAQTPTRIVPNSSMHQMPSSTKVTLLNKDGTPISPRLDQKPAGARSTHTPSLSDRSVSRQPPSHQKSPSIPGVRGSPESPKVPRPVQSGSPSSPSPKLKGIRTSEDSAPHRVGNVARNFEELIQSDQTLQYTLTPENMRDVTVSSSSSSRPPQTPSQLTHQSNKSVHESSPAISSKARRSEDTKRSEHSRTSSKRSMSVSKNTGLGSHPPAEISGHSLSGSVPKVPHQIPHQSPGKTRTGSVASGSARDPRIPRESTQDFADFIRATGPPGDVGPKQTGGPIPGPIRQNSGTAAPPARNPSLDERNHNSMSRNRPQAREPGSDRNESSDLIDFIRRGPPNPGGANANGPRISRQVAPFRNTMDSDQLQASGATGGRAVDAVLPPMRGSQASTNMTEHSAPSSMNSQSALVKKANSQAGSPAVNQFDDEMIPKRKQRRVKDPYAIDLSDEEDEELAEPMPKPKGPVKREESLIDFLNNYEPPPGPEPQLFNLSQTQPKKKASAPNLMSRLRSNGNSNSTSSNSNKSPVNSTPRVPANQSGKAKGHTPITVNMPPTADRYQAEYMNQQQRPQGRSSGRVPMKKFEPRDAVPTSHRTSELAAFLRDSEPPPSFSQPPRPLASPPPPEEKPSSGFSRMFERKKKPVY